MFCKRCGSENPDGAKFCRKCGASIAVESTVSQQMGQRNYEEGKSQQQYQQQYQQPYTAPHQSSKMTIDDLPAEYRPIGMWGYFGYSLLFNIPFIGWIIALVFAFGVTSNVNLRNYARGCFCGLIVMVVLFLLLSMGGCSLAAMFS